MSRAIKTSQRQQGVAVITALLLTTLAITIVASLFWQQQVQVRTIENQRMQLQKQWILRGALDWARLILREDARNSSEDHLGEPWATPLATTKLDQYVENGRSDDDSEASLSGNIQDAQARFNLANLAASGTINPSEVAVFGKLLANVGLNSSLAQAAANLMASAQGQSAVGGAGGGLATQGSDSKRPMTIVQPEDLLAVPGFTVEMLGKLRDFIIVLPRATPININTAPAEVLSARIDTLSPAEAAGIVISRKTAYFRSKAELLSRLSVQPASLGDTEVSVGSNFFLVYGDVRLSRAALQVQSLIERTQAGTNLIWIREN